MADTKKEQCTIPIVIGSIFKMQGNNWKVKTEGIKDWYGVVCQNSGSAFISMHTDEIREYIGE